jgi:hypothetical protein
MAFQGNGLISQSDSNYFSFNARKPDEGKLPNISDLILGSNHTFIIDSRNREQRFFPDPANYSIDIPVPYKNVTSIELKGSVFPRCEHNVNSSNFIIPFNVEDNITSIKIRDPGYGYVNGTYGFGTGPPNNTVFLISDPAIVGGNTAQVIIVIANNIIDSITIPVSQKGSGYLRGYYGDKVDPAKGFYSKSGAYVINNIPRESSLSDRFKQANLEVEIGHTLQAKLRFGQYDFTNPNDSLPGLAREVTRSLQEAVDEAIAQGILVPVTNGPQNGEEYFPYAPTLGDLGSTYLTTLNENASPNNRVVIQRGKNDGTFSQSLFLELLWCSCSNDLLYSTSKNLLGYGSSTIEDYRSKLSPPIDQTSGSISTLVIEGAWVATPVTARNDYDIINTSDYFMLEFGGGELDRVESNDDVIEKCFATLIFDGNSSNHIWRAPSNSITAPGTGNSSLSTLLVKPGQNKMIKGNDVDVKNIVFTTPIAELSSLAFSFKKNNGQLYNFQGRDHLLIFSINCDDINTANRF